MFLFVRRREVWPFLSGVFLICSCGLMLQIAETRLISVILWYHLAFFAISMAMLGIAAGSLLIYYRTDLFPGERLLENLVCIGSAFSISVVLSTLSLITTIAPSGIANTLLFRRRRGGATRDLQWRIAPAYRGRRDRSLP
jgi:hypothetical protein